MVERLNDYGNFYGCSSQNHSNAGLERLNEICGERNYLNGRWPDSFPHGGTQAAAEYSASHPPKGSI
jgi:hypothetical protein